MIFFNPDVGNEFCFLGFTACTFNPTAVPVEQAIGSVAFQTTSTVAWIYSEDHEMLYSQLEQSQTTTTSSSEVPDATQRSLLARPKDFRLMWKSSGTLKNITLRLYLTSKTGLNTSSDCSIWRPLPPSDEYVAVSFLVSDSFARPDPKTTKLRYSPWFII